MRWTRIIAPLLVLWVAYFVWPYFGMRSLVQAVRKQDVAGVNERINFPALRRSLAGQIIVVYLQMTGQEARLGPFRDFAISGASSMADPLVAQLISAETLIDFLASGWPTTVLPEKMPALKGLSTGAVGNVWQVFLNSEHGLRTFSISLPANVGPEYQFTLHFQLSSWSWRLYDITLPKELLTRLASELIRTVNKK
jgi:Protein of unknown function (DUF2939)